MADETLDQQNVINLTKATLSTALIQVERERLRLDQQELEAQKKLVKEGSQRAAQLDKEINQIQRKINIQSKELATSQKEIQTKRDAIVVGNRTLKGISDEIKAKEALQKEYATTVSLIKKSGASYKEQQKAIKNLQQQMKQKFGGKDFMPQLPGFKAMWGAAKRGDFEAVAKTFKEAGGAQGLLGNVIKTFGRAGIVVSSLATAFRIFRDNVIVPSARMQNLAGQQMGVAAGSRNLWGGSWIGSWANRALLGYSAQEQQGLFSSLVDAMRISPNAPGAKGEYQNALTGMMAVQRIWGTDTNTLGRIYKAFYQTGTTSGHLSERFNRLMRSVEGTGWTTSEYADILAKNMMYLKNFGVNLDVYSKDLLKYGQAIREEKLTAEEIGPRMRGESSQEMGFVARKMLESGIISEKELGAGLGDNLFKQAGALRAFSAINPQRYRQMMFRLYHTNPQYRSLLENAGVLGDELAEWEFMTRNNLPGAGALQGTFAEKGPRNWNQVVRGELGATESQGLGDTSTQGQLVNEAWKNVASTTAGLKGLMLDVAKMFANFANGIPDNPADLGR